MKNLIALFLVGAGISSAASILIRNVTIHPVTQPDIPSGSVLITEDRIAAIGANVQAPADAQVIDGAGLHLYPGLINAATNIGLQEIESLRDTVDLDEIGLFNPEVRAVVAVNPSSAHVETTRASGITSVLSLPGSGERFFRNDAGIITGQGAFMHLAGWTWEQMAVRPSAVMEIVFPEIQELPAEFAIFLGEQGRSYNDLKKEHDEQVRKLKDFFDEARRYQHAAAAAGPDFHRDARLEAMIPVLEGKMPIFVRAAREQTIKDAVAFADEQKVKMILANPIELGSTGPLLKQHGVPVVFGEVFRLPTHDDDPYDAPYTLPSEFYKAGVKLCFGTFDVQFARNVAFQAAQAVAFGLPHDEALKALTINSAEIFGVGDKLGSIEPGKIADLILTDGDPMEASTNIKAMFINGHQVSLESRHTREYEIWSARP